MRNNILFLLVVVISFNAVAPAFAQEPAKAKAAPMRKKEAAKPPSPDEEAPKKDDDTKPAPAAAATPAAPAGQTTTDPTTGLFHVFNSKGELDWLQAYFVLLGVSAVRAMGLLKLFETLPEARKALAELRTFRQYNKEEYDKAQAALKALEELRVGRNPVGHAVTKSTEAYAERLHQLEVLMHELGGLEQIKQDAAAVQALREAKEAWTLRGEYAPIHAFVEKERGRRLRFKNGKEWLSKFDTWRKQERAEAQIVADNWNALVDAVNKGLPTNDRKSKLRTHDNNFGHSPGNFFYANNNPVSHSDVALNAKDICSQTWKQLHDRSLDFGGKTGLWGNIGLAKKVATPGTSVALTAGSFGLLYYAKHRAIKQYGKAPEVARAEKNLMATIENEVNIRAEAGLDSQVTKRKEEFKPFTDIVVEEIIAHSDEILASLEEFEKLNPDVPLQLERKRALFKDKEQLAKHVLQAIPAAGQKIAKDVNASQILSLLALATKPETQKEAEVVHKRFLYALYGKIMDNTLPEVEALVEVGAEGNKDLVPVYAGVHMGKIIRTSIVPTTLPKMHKMKITEPENVAPLPILPEKPKDPPAPQVNMPPPVDGRISVTPADDVVPTAKPKTERLGAVITPVTNSVASSPTTTFVLPGESLTGSSLLTGGKK